MLLADVERMRKLQEARKQPNLCFLPFSAGEILAQIRRGLFPEFTIPIDIHFVDGDSLACICPQPDRADIYVHQILNHDQTPREVISLICKHELLHLRIPQDKSGSKLLMHPPAFWEAERQLAPERRVVWPWVWTNLDECLKQRKRLERIDVLKKWKRVWSRPRIDVSECLARCSPRIIPDGEKDAGW